MNDNPETPKGIVPYLCVSDAKAALAFYEKAFGATELFRMPDEKTGRLMHATMNLNGGRLFLADDFPEYKGGQESTPQRFGGTPVTLHIQVDDVDAVIKQAVEHGATVIMPADDMFWGDRFGKVRDPFGHEWSIATTLPQKADTPSAPKA